jgi:hypothetical protein
MKLSIGKSKSYYVYFISIVLTLLAMFIIFKPFSSKNLAINIFQSCAVDNVGGADNVDGVWVAKKNSAIIVQGWVSDPKKKVPADDILLQLIDNENNVLRSVIHKSDFDRPDVEKAFNNSAMKYSGYNINLTPVTVPGEYTILLGSSYPNLNSICTKVFKLRISE